MSERRKQLMRRRRPRAFRLVTAAGLVAALVALSAGVSFADTLDALEGGSTINLGEIAPGGGASGSGGFNIKCSGQKHAAHGTLGFNAPSITLNPGSAGTAGEVTATPTATIPNSWPADNTGCGSTTTTPGSLGVSVSVPSGAASGDRSIKVQFSSSDTDVSATLNFTVAYTVSEPAPSDTSPPSISYTLNPASPDGDNGWYKSTVTLTWNVSEPESPGSLVKTGCVNQSITTDQAATTYLCSATSDGGSAGPVSVTIKRDATKPTLSPSVSPNPVLLNGSATASPNASDNLSGIASASCGAVDTSSVGGSKSVTCNATDNAGNTNNGSANYSVGYKFVGFSQPVDNNGVLNVAKAGSAIPLKWRLLDANDAPVTNLSSVNVTVASLSCSSGTTADEVEEYAAGASGLQNLGDGYYQFNWKTPTNYANSCKTLQLNLGEGSNRTALFQFRK